MNVKIINGDILVHDNEIYTKRKILKIETLHFSMTKKDQYKRIRKHINENPEKGKFKSMLEEKLNE